MDRVGFEPTTSASTIYLKEQLWKENINCSNPTRSTLRLRLRDEKNKERKSVACISVVECGGFVSYCYYSATAAPPAASSSTVSPSSPSSSVLAIVPLVASANTVPNVCPPSVLIFATGSFAVLFLSHHVTPHYYHLLLILHPPN
jgi:hypothetical protein